MINILLADDDILTLNQLNTYISMLDFCHIAGQVQDGIAAISFLRKTSAPIHLIILDMEMPKMTGIKVAEYIKAHELPVIILALSNYDNFEYVKPIFRLGAWDYLLKHELNPRLLSDKLREISSYLAQQEQATLQTDFTTSLSRQNFLYRLALDQPIPDEQMLFSLSDAMFCTNRYFLILMQITNYFTIYKNNYENRHQKIIDMVLNLSNTILTSLGQSIITHTTTGEFLIYVNSHSEVSIAGLEHKKEHYIQVLKSNLAKYLNINTIFESVLVHDNIQAMRTYYLKIHHDLQCQPFNKQFEGHQDNNFYINIHQEKELLDAVSRCDVKRAVLLLKQIFEPLISQNISLYQMQHLVNRLLEIIHLLFQEYPGISEVFQNTEQIPDLLDIEKLEIYLIHYYESIILHINQNSLLDYPPLIQSALVYVHQNFGNDISLCTAAEACAITDSYLSKIFKQTMGISFSKYLSNYRIHMASSFLLQTQYSLKEVASKCGFQNYNYFLTVFKSTVGLTPAQYRIERPSLNWNFEKEGRPLKQKEPE